MLHTGVWQALAAKPIDGFKGSAEEGGVPEGQAGGRAYQAVNGDLPLIEGIAVSAFQGKCQLEC